MNPFILILVLCAGVAAFTYWVNIGSTPDCPPGTVPLHSVAWRWVCVEGMEP